MKKTTIAYWVLTGLFALLMFGSAVFNIMVSPESVQGFRELGLPAHLIPFLGWAKLLGVLAILIPGYPRLKEWAYAGLCYDLLGAAYCIASIGKTPINWIPVLAFAGVGFGSYLLYHKRKKASGTLHNVPDATLIEAV